MSIQCAIRNNSILTLLILTNAVKPTDSYKVVEDSVAQPSKLQTSHTALS